MNPWHFGTGACPRPCVWEGAHIDNAAMLPESSDCPLKVVAYGRDSSLADRTRVVFGEHLGVAPLPVWDWRPQANRPAVRSVLLESRRLRKLKKRKRRGARMQIPQPDDQQHADRCNQGYRSKRCDERGYGWQAAVTPFSAPNLAHAKREDLAEPANPWRQQRPQVQAPQASNLRGDQWAASMSAKQLRFVLSHEFGGFARGFHARNQASHLHVLFYGDTASYRTAAHHILGTSFINLGKGRRRGSERIHEIRAS